ncbi:MAG: hypothetical protein KatS3mg130_0474 [Candidatus Sumerlaea sp.]|nr:MAG: hypothetical protein KatS3mg130_0474 [Candidatus Sumerlaea sp.]
MPSIVKLKRDGAFCLEKLRRVAVPLLRRTLLA